MEDASYLMPAESFGYGFDCLSWLPIDYKTGFGGQFGVQTDRVDKSALSWEHHEKVEKHESQKGDQSQLTAGWFVALI